MRGSMILGIGHHQPERVMTNHEIAELVDTSDEWIASRTGIQERRIAGDDETVATMATAAGRMALEDSGVAPEQISLVVVASTTAEVRTPNTAGRVAADLGLNGPAIIDLNTACSGFEYALAVADQAVRAGAAGHALVIGAEKLSAFTDWTDRTTCVLTADGAGAMVIGPTDEPTIGPVVWGSVPGMVDAVRIDGTPAYFSQEGRAVFRGAISEAADHARRIVKAAGLEMEDIEVFVFHQANLRIIEPLASALHAGSRLVVTDVVESGNTSAASVPLGFSKAWHRGDIPKGVPALLFGFGGGFTYAGLVVRTPSA